MKKVHYFYEGETEKKLLQHLKNKGDLLPGHLRKHNLWNTVFKLARTINPSDHLFFFIDTDITSDLSIFKNNIDRLKPYNIFLMVQHKTLEDELCFSCNKKSNHALYKDFYGVTSPKEFKTKFINENNLNGKLASNNFEHKKLWIRKSAFNDLLTNKGISITTLYKIKTNPLRQ